DIERKLRTRAQGESAAESHVRIYNSRVGGGDRLPPAAVDIAVDESHAIIASLSGHVERAIRASDAKSRMTADTDTGEGRRQHGELTTGAGAAPDVNLAGGHIHESGEDFSGIGRSHAAAIIKMTFVAVRYAVFHRIANALIILESHAAIGRTGNTV